MCAGRFREEGFVLPKVWTGQRKLDDGLGTPKLLGAVGH